MAGPTYDRAKTKKAMWLAPAAGVIGLLPFIFNLDLSFIQLLVVLLVVILASYVLGLVFGAPGYFTLKSMGKHETKFLIAYAAILVVITAVLVRDPYALLFFGPPTLIVAGVFCYLRGSAIADQAA